MINIKKIIVLISVIILSIIPVLAEEINETNESEELKDITNNVEIRYKWYKEKITGDYYPLKDNQKDYIVDTNKIKPGYVSTWDSSNCNLPQNHYFLEYDFRMTYECVKEIRFVEIKGITYNDNIKIYYQNEPIEYQIITNEENLIVLNLIIKYLPDTLIFYIDTNEEYQITLYAEKYLKTPILTKTVSSNIPIIPDETWITSTTKYQRKYTTHVYKETALTKLKSQSQICRTTEILAYKYKIEREYYDENYYTYVEGYIKDESDYKLFYKEEPIINTIEITKEITKEKIVKQPQIQYIYLPSKNEIQKLDSSKNNENSIQEKTECTPQIKTEIKTEYETIERYSFKTPKKVYIIIIILILILMIIFLLIKLYKKYVDGSF